MTKQKLLELFSQVWYLRLLECYSINEMKKADDENFDKKVESFVKENYKNQNDNTGSNNAASAETATYKWSWKQQQW